MSVILYVHVHVRLIWLRIKTSEEKIYTHDQQLEKAFVSIEDLESEIRPGATVKTFGFLDSFIQSMGAYIFR